MADDCLAEAALNGRDSSLSYAQFLHTNLLGRDAVLA